MQKKTNLKIRIIPSILVDNYQVIKSKQFSDYRTFGNLTQVVELFSRRFVDELVILDIESSKKKIPIDSRILKLMTLNSLIPITYGGGIKTLSDIENCLFTGCEKIILNSILYENPRFLSEAVKSFGSQSITVSIDVRLVNDEYKIFNHINNKIEAINLFDYLMFCQDSSCGEIVINSVDKDGMMTGYDLDLISNLRNYIDRPFVINGGCSKPKDIKDAINKGADACMAASIFYFTRYSYADIKDFLKRENISIRK